MRPLGLLVAGAALIAAACGDDAATTAGSGGAGQGGGGSTSTSAGGSGGGGSLEPGDFLEPERYDCRAAGSDVPVGERPHDGTCLMDPACSSQFLMGHRMANPFAPENTLSALRAAIQLGVDVAETDIRITADGRVVLIHDAEVDRTLEGTGDVSSLTLAEIQAMKVRVGSSDPPGEFGCDHAPSLEEAMAVAQGKIVLELETKNVEAAPLAAAYLRDEGLTDWAYIQCDAEECAAVRAAVPDTRIAFRMQSLEELEILAELDPPPILLEIDNDDELLNDPELRALVEARGIKVFTNVFVTADVLAALDDLSGYQAELDRGFDMIQTELPHLALFGLGRIAPR